MNDFTIKKVAEVAAFCTLANIILERSGSPFDKSVPEVANVLRSISLVELGVKNKKQRQLYAAKVTKTTTKLTTMMELYIGDEWDNPVEVLEWLSFYAGAAAAHATLAVNALQVSGENIYDVEQNLHMFDTLLDVVKEKLGMLGTKRATPEPLS